MPKALQDRHGQPLRKGTLVRVYDNTVPERVFGYGYVTRPFQSVFNELAFDHDLGDERQPERTGYDLLCAIERGDLRKPRKARLITWNPVGRARMLVVIRRLWAGA